MIGSDPFRCSRTWLKGHPSFVGAGLGVVTILLTFGSGVHAQTSELDQGFAATIDGKVGVIRLVTNGQIYIGGSFTLVNGSVRTRIARLQPDGSLDPSFDANVDGIAGQYESTNIAAIGVQPDQRVLIG